MAVLAACGGNGGGNGGTEDGDDPAGKAACSRFRNLSFEAVGEAVTERQIVAGLEEVSSLAEESTHPAIANNGAVLAEEADPAALISGEPDPALDAFADACNAAFPL
jgi:hypothetical protein